MKRIAAIAVVCLALLPGAPASALGPLGSMAPEPQETGTLSASAGYFYREMEFVPKKPDFEKVTVKQHHVYLQASEEAFGWEWGGRIGVADFSDGHRFSASYKPFAGLLLKGFIYGDRSSDIAIVANFRGDIYSGYRVSGVEVSPGLIADVKVKDLWDFEAGLTAQKRLGNSLTVYAGPTFDYIEGKVYRQTTVPIGVEMTEDSYHKQKPKVGASAGLLWKRGGTSYGVEAGYAGKLSLGVEATLAF